MHAHTSRGVFWFEQRAVVLQSRLDCSLYLNKEQLYFCVDYSFVPFARVEKLIAIA